MRRNRDVLHVCNHTLEWTKEVSIVLLSSILVSIFSGKEC